jgi:hypothetical protein
MSLYGAVRWQPTSVLVEAYNAVGDALRGDRVRVGDVLECWRYVDALESELADRGVLRDPMTSALSLVARNVTK